MLRGGDDRENLWQQTGVKHLDDLRKAVSARTHDSNEAVVYDSTITELEKSFNSMDR